METSCHPTNETSKVSRIVSTWVKRYSEKQPRAAPPLAVHSEPTDVTKVTEEDSSDLVGPNGRCCQARPLRGPLRDPEYGKAYHIQIVLTYLSNPRINWVAISRTPPTIVAGNKRLASFDNLRSPSAADNGPRALDVVWVGDCVSIVFDRFPRGLAGSYR